MENLEEVVKERNRAYYELETGTTGTVGRVVVDPVEFASVCRKWN